MFTIVFIGDAMNRNQVKGAVKDAAGKVQQKMGDASDSQRQQAKGLEKQAEGKLQKAAGNMQDAAKRR
jgi:uncharacterized protein YjbJ (UPF0337 family)